MQKLFLAKQRLIISKQQTFICAEWPNLEPGKVFVARADTLYFDIDQELVALADCEMLRRDQCNVRVGRWRGLGRRLGRGFDGSLGWSLGISLGRSLGGSLFTCKVFSTFQIKSYLDRCKKSMNLAETL